MMKRVRLLISGRVQGVFFRANTARMAEKLGLAGWVRNLDDDRVEAVFEGPEEKIEKAAEWCRKGSSIARVDRVEVVEEKPEGLKNFEVLR